MKSIFALFKDISAGREAVNALLYKGFKEERMNAIIQESIAKSSLNISRQNIKSEASPVLEGKKVHGLERLFAGQQPIESFEAGKILAAGKSATILANASTSGPVKKVYSLKTAFSNFGLPSHNAEIYSLNISSGEMLFWIRTDDSQTPEAVNILRDYEASEIVTVQ